MKRITEMNIHNYEIIYLDTVDSTNTYAMENADNEGLNPYNHNLIVADEQTAGKGRLGRSFESNKGAGIFASVVVRPDKKTYDVAGITLVVALAVQRAFDKMGIETNIKWPNDIICQGKKLCGILTEMKNDGDRVKFVVVGIGINVNNKEFSGDLEEKATSLYLLQGKTFDRTDILVRVLQEFNMLYDQYIKNDNLHFMKDEYNEKLINRGSEVVVEYKNEKKIAIQLGVDDKGVLKVLLDGEKVSITSGEIKIRGVLGYV